MKKNPTHCKNCSDLEKRVDELGKVVQFMQMLFTQTGQGMQNMSGDLHMTMNLQRLLGFNLRALMELTGVSEVQIDEVSRRIQIDEFQKMSDTEDINGGFTSADVATDIDTVIFTTTQHDDPNGGILRSRIALPDISDPSLRDAFVGKRVGEEFDMEINGVHHRVTMLGVRVPPVAEEAVEGE